MYYKEPRTLCRKISKVIVLSKIPLIYIRGIFIGNTLPIESSLWYIIEISMKYIFSTITVVLAIVGFSTVSYAQTVKSAVVAPAPTLFDIQANTSLTVRKQFVETNLRDLITKLDAVYTRVAIASDRLSSNGIDSTLSDKSLAIAQTALIAAQTHLDTFVLVPVDEKPATIATLRTHAKLAEESLRNARAAIIESISALKVTISTQ